MQPSENQIYYGFDMSSVTELDVLAEGGTGVRELLSGAARQ